MARLKNAPNMKAQDNTGESLITICLGAQAWDIGKQFDEMGRSADEIALDSAFGDGGKNPPCVVVDDEVLTNLEQYRIAPKKARNIRLINANHGERLNNELLDKVLMHLVQTTSAESVIYCNEAGELIEDVSRYIQRLRNGETYHGEVKPIDDSYAKLFAQMADNERVKEFLNWTDGALKVDSVNSLPYLWTGKKWQWLTEKDLGRQIRDFFLDKGLTYNKRRIDNMIGLMLDYDLEPMGKRNADLLGFSNGVLHKKTGEFLPHLPEYYLTSFIDVEYTTTPPATPNFNKWLDWVSDNDQGKADRILAGLYMILTNRYEWQMYLDVTGVGGSGKSVFNELAKLLAGEQNSVSITLKELESQTARAKLIDKTFIYSPDQSSYVGDGAELRAVTGGDEISVRMLYRDSFDTRINAIFLMTSNGNVVFTEHNGGMARRRVIFHFDKAVPRDERDNHLKEKLRAELAGIVRLLLDKFKKPKDAELLLIEQLKSTEALGVKQNFDHILDFTQHFTTKTEIRGLFMGSARAKMDKAERQFLYSAYLFYCDCMGVTKPLNRNRFIDAFKQALKETHAPHEFQRRPLDGKNITNVYYIDIGRTLIEWNG